MTRKFRIIEQNSTAPNSVNAKLACLFNEELPELKGVLRDICKRLETIEGYLETRNGFERWGE